MLFTGPTGNGSLLEVVVLDAIGEDEPAVAIHAMSLRRKFREHLRWILMPRTRAQLEQAAADAEAWLDTLDPSELDNPDATDLRRIGTALGAVVAAEHELTEAVRLARAQGRSWADIAMVLGVSREAARKRYDAPAVPQPRIS